MSTINKLWDTIKSCSKWAEKKDITVVKVADVKKQAPKALDKLERNKLIRDIDRAFIDV